MRAFYSRINKLQVESLLKTVVIYETENRPEAVAVDILNKDGPVGS